MDNISIYSEARNEYLKQLSTWIVPPLVEFFRTEYDRLVHSDGRGAMRAFQTFCSEVPRWNQDVIEKNINIILDNCRCDYVEELMTAVFIAHTKMLTAIRVSTKQKKLSITLPKLDHFLHRVFTECARSFWKAPFLFAENSSAIEKQKNILQAESMCVEAVSGAVRSLLPVKNILRDYLDESESEEEVVPKKKGKPTPEEESDSEDETAVAPEGVKHSLPFAAKDLVEEIESEPVPEPAPEPAPEPVPAPEPAPAPEPVPAPEPATAPVVIEKLETPPPPPLQTISNHEVKEVEMKEGLKLEKLETSPEVNADAPKLLIDTEPSVHFTPYDTVFDENTPGISEIRYSEKVSVEDKPPSNWGMFDDDDDDEAPRLSISGSGSAIMADDVEDLDGPTVPVVSAVTPEEDFDAPLGATADFESLD